ncbi:RNA polymerase sigma factor [Micromonospora sp. WMMD558]|uniref:RNA polymerase sigma factor n=1 Tax=unclassified Micromonospora TaxID=2617518 RepID=UPI0012B44A3B|nr:sigma-70 family RNA polymerase sigma factor [Micromonospora sp. WMMC415]QGN46428.1 sigma-70 family RNA polymerase sigma factor [Micromonospora sp. WMMC415]
MPSQTEIQLAQGQLAEFATYYEGDYKPLVGLLIRWGASRHEAEDVTQEAMHVALMNWPTIKSPKSFTRTVALRILHRGWQVAEREVTAARHVAQDTAVESFDANEDRPEVMSMLRALPEAQRVVFVLHCDGYGHTEISEITGQQRDTVRSNLRHARQKVLRMLDPESTRKEATHGP